MWAPGLGSLKGAGWISRVKYNRPHQLTPNACTQTIYVYFTHSDSHFVSFVSPWFHISVKAVLCNTVANIIFSINCLRQPATHPPPDRFTHKPIHRPIPSVLTLCRGIKQRRTHTYTHWLFEELHETPLWVGYWHSLKQSDYSKGGVCLICFSTEPSIIRQSPMGLIFYLKNKTISPYVWQWQFATLLGLRSVAEYGSVLLLCSTHMEARKVYSSQLLLFISQFQLGLCFAKETLYLEIDTSFLIATVSFWL